MPIVKTFDKEDFSEEVKNYFTKRGASLLFDYLGESGGNVEIAPMQFGLEFTETTLEEYNKNHETNYKNMEELQDNAGNF